MTVESVLFKDGHLAIVHMIINGKDMKTLFKGIFKPSNGLFDSVFNPNRTQQKEMSFLDNGATNKMQAGQRAYLRVQKYSGIKKVNKNNLK